MKGFAVLALALVCGSQAVSLHHKRNKAHSKWTADEVQENTGCSGSEFGCCPDGTSPAAGAHYSGCEATEMSSTIATENCASTAFGCCQDQVRAASGAGFAGCGGDGTVPSEPDKLGSYPEDISAEDRSLEPSVPDFWQPDNIHEARANDMRPAEAGGLPYEGSRSFRKDILHLPQPVPADEAAEPDSASADQEGAAAEQAGESGTPETESTAADATEGGEEGGDDTATDEAAGAATEAPAEDAGAGTDAPAAAAAATDAPVR